MEIVAEVVALPNYPAMELVEIELLTVVIAAVALRAFAEEIARVFPVTAVALRAFPVTAVAFPNPKMLAVAFPNFKFAELAELREHAKLPSAAFATFFVLEGSGSLRKFAEVSGNSLVFSTYCG